MNFRPNDSQRTLEPDTFPRRQRIAWRLEGGLAAAGVRPPAGSRKNAALRHRVISAHSRTILLAESALGAQPAVA
jgi:hypothetical protein